jgi:hypothetical protein
MAASCVPAPPRCAGRPDVRRQGPVRHRRRSHRRGQPALAGDAPGAHAQQPAGRPAAGGRGHVQGQVAHRRTGLQHPRRQPALRHARQRACARPRAGRLVQRLGGGGGGAAGGLRAGHRHRRLHPRAGQLLRPLGVADHARTAVAGGPGAAASQLRHADLAGALGGHLRPRRRRAVATGRDVAWQRAQRWQPAWDQADAVFHAPLEAAWHSCKTSACSARVARCRCLSARRLAAGVRQRLGARRLAGARCLDRRLHARLRRPVAQRFQFASTLTDAVAQAAREQQAVVRASPRLLGTGGVALVPSAASVAPLRDAAAADVDAVRLRTLRITCLAGLAGLPQVSLPCRAPDGLPVGVSLVGPPGSRRIADRVGAQRVHAAMPAHLVDSPDNRPPCRAHPPRHAARPRSRRAPPARQASRSPWWRPRRPPTSSSASTTRCSKA